MDTVAHAETSAIISTYIDQLKLEQLAPSTLEKYAQNLRYFRDYVKDAPIAEYIATQLVEQGVSLNVIRDLPGHVDISTTAIYLDMNPKHLQSAVNMLPDF